MEGATDDLDFASTDPQIHSIPFLTNQNVHLIPQKSIVLNQGQQEEKNTKEDEKLGKEEKKKPEEIKYPQVDLLTGRFVLFTPHFLFLSEPFGISDPSECDEPQGDLLTGFCFHLHLYFTFFFC